MTGLSISVSRKGELQLNGWNAVSHVQLTSTELGCRQERLRLICLKFSYYDHKYLGNLKVTSCGWVRELTVDHIISYQQLMLQFFKT